MMFINIHTHGAHQHSGIAIAQMHHPDSALAPQGLYSAGLHPWRLTEDGLSADVESLSRVASHPQVLAIGECGIDKLCKTGLHLQTNAFALQVRLANAIQKPLILHCVRAQQEILQILEKENNKVPAIFHGYHRKLHLAEAAMAAGCYLSFGKALQEAGMQAVLKAIPADRFFVETDDASISIAEIYALAATARQISIEELSLQLHKNFETVFKRII